MLERRRVLRLILWAVLAITVAIGISGCVTEKYSYLEMYGTYIGEIEVANTDGGIDKKEYTLTLYLDGRYEATEVENNGKGNKEYGSFKFSPIALENYRIALKAEVAVDCNGCATEKKESVFGKDGLKHVQTEEKGYRLESDGISLKRTDATAEEMMQKNVLLGAFGGSIVEDVIEMRVEESVERVKVGDLLYFSPETEWDLYYDENMTARSASKVAKLDRGNTELYISIGEEDEYKIDIYREFEVPVIFESEGEESVKIKVLPNCEISKDKIPEFSRTGYELVGFADSDGKVWQIGKEVITIGSEYREYKFTAVWEAKEYNAAFMVDDETFGETVVKFNEEYEMPVPEKAGHIFLGWSDGEELVCDENGQSTGVWLYAEDKVFFAEWQKKKYSLTVVSETSDGGEFKGQGEYEYGEEAEITVTTLNGYTFAGWYSEDGEKISDEKIVKRTIEDGDEVLTAKFEEFFLEILVTGAVGNVDLLRQRTESGTEVVPVISEIPDGTWNGWYENGEKICEEFEYRFVMPRRNRRIEARWVASGVMTAADFLDKIAANETIELASDIDLSGEEWTVVGAYSGEINGNGYAIRNITVNNTYEENGIEYAGLFGTFCGTVYDVVFENIYVEVVGDKPLYAGLFAGKAEAFGTVRNVSINGELRITASSEIIYAAGFVGISEGELTNISVNCEIIVSPNTENDADIVVGGFIAKAEAFSIVSDCTVSGSITIESNSGSGNVTETTHDFVAVSDEWAEIENNVSDVIIGLNNAA